MNDNVKYYIIYTILYGIILLIGEGLYRYLKVNPAWTRNFSHLTAGLVSLPYPWVFTSHWWVLLIAVQSSFILFGTRRYGFIPSHHRIAGNGVGSFLFFASIYLCFLVSFYTGQKFLFIVPILVLSISDVTASIVGRKLGKKPLNIMKRFVIANKTYAGSIAFFLSAMVVVFLLLYIYLDDDLFHASMMALVVSLAASITEAISPRGYDNFSVPLTTLIIMWLGYVI